jgi:fermentation-respiration switch protein FrsA (DUF1100 family)
VLRSRRGWALPVLAVLLLVVAALSRCTTRAMGSALMNSLLYFPLRQLEASPAAHGLVFQDVAFAAEDGVRLHGWWIAARGQDRLGHVLHFHGNGGNISHRLLDAEALARAGFDVFLLDYRGYGRSEGHPSEAGTYRDARAARQAALARPEVDPARLYYLGESLGGAVALNLALETAPRGLVLQSVFTSVRDMARLHYPVVPAAIVPDAYPSLRRVRDLRSPLLVLHGEVDDLVPVAHGRAIFAAAPEPKHLHVFPRAGHNDLLLVAGQEYARVIEAWARSLP